MGLVTRALNNTHFPGVAGKVCIVQRGLEKLYKQRLHVQSFNHDFHLFV